MSYPLELVAWTGGDLPTDKGIDIGDRKAPVFLAMRSALFREALADFRDGDGTGKGLYQGWGPGQLTRDTARILWKRATADAWRSYTEHKRTERKATANVDRLRGFLKGKAFEELTAYALRCGGVQSTELISSRGRWRVELYREHNAYHVRSIDYVKRDKGEPLNSWRVWKSFDVGQLKEARKEYRRMVRSFRTGK